MQPTEKTYYAYTVFHDPTYGASPPWPDSGWLTARRTGLEQAGLAVTAVDGPVLKLRAAGATGASAAGDRPRPAQAYVAAQLDLWWLAVRTPDADSALLALDEVDLPAGFLQHVVVAVTSGAGPVGSRALESGRCRRLMVDLGAGTEPGPTLDRLDDLCWFDGARVGWLARYLVEAAKLEQHYTHRATLLRRGAAGETQLNRAVIDPLNRYARTLLERSAVIENAQHARASGDRDASARLRAALTATRREESADRLITALQTADQNLLTLSGEIRSARTLAYNLGRMERELDRALPPELVPTDRLEAEQVASEFERAHDEVEETVGSVSRAQDRVATLLTEREQDLEAERNRALELQAAILTGVGLLIAAVQAGGVIKSFAASLGAAGLLVVLFVNGRDGYGPRHRAAVGLLAGTLAATATGLSFDGRHHLTIVGVGIGGAAIGWLLGGIDPAWFHARPGAIADRMAVAVGAAAIVASLLAWGAFSGLAHADVVTGIAMGAAAAGWALIEAAHRLLRRGPARGGPDPEAAA